jgi:hypothetical protein
MSDEELLTTGLLVKQMKNQRDIDIIFGPASVALFILIYDIVALKKKKKTISTSIRRLTTQSSFGPEIAGAILGGLAFHLFLKQN